MTRSSSAPTRWSGSTRSCRRRCGRARASCRWRWRGSRRRAGRSAASSRHRARRALRHRGAARRRRHGRGLSRRRQHARARASPSRSIQATSTRQLDALRRFIREAGAAATLTHPAVVRMLHVDVCDEGLLFQVQELVDGETLTARLGAQVAAGRRGAARAPCSPMRSPTPTRAASCIATSSRTT